MKYTLFMYRRSECYTSRGGVIESECFTEAPQYSRSEVERLSFSKPNDAILAILDQGNTRIKKG